VRELNKRPLAASAVNKTTATTIERRVHEQLEREFRHVRGNSANGPDLPNLGIDVKVRHCASRSRPPPTATQARRSSACHTGSCCCPTTPLTPASSSPTRSSLAASRPPTDA
jgi:hypothetical protein